ncbi:MAG: FtsX-like permease family protein [Caulobacterales bacterium]|jgi:putative ABC transport system permease protein
MSTALSLVFAYLRARPLSNLLYVIMLGLGVAASVALLLFSDQTTRRLERDAANVDLVVGHKGSPLQLVMAAVFHADAPAGNIPADTVARLRADPRVKSAIPVALGDSLGPFRIVGAPLEVLSLYDARLALGVGYEAPFEAVIGADVARARGLEVGGQFVGAHGLGGDGHEHAETPYTVVGVLARTGTVADRLILTSLESVWDVHGIAHDHDQAADDHDHTAHDHDHALDAPAAAAAPAQQGIFVNRSRIEAPKADVTAVLVQVIAPMGGLAMQRELNRDTTLLAARPAEEAARVFRLVGVGGQVLQAFAFILIAAAAASVFTTLFAALRERRGEIALLRAMGATRGTVFAVLAGQGLVIAVFGVLLGLAGGHGLVELLARVSPQAEGFGLTGLAWHPGEWVIALGGALVGLLAALPAAIGAYRTDIAKTLSEVG